MSSWHPVPKPRTRFNVGAVCEANPIHQKASDSSTNETSENIKIIKEKGGCFSEVSTERLQNKPPRHIHVLPPPYPPPPPPPRPRPPASDVKISAESTLSPLCLPHPPSDLVNHHNSAFPNPSPPVTSRPKEWETVKPACSNNNLYDNVSKCSSPHISEPDCRNIDFIENPIYMSLFSFRKISFGDVENKTEADGLSSKHPSTPLDPKMCDLPRGESESSDGVEENDDMQKSLDFSCLSDSSHCALERNIPPSRSVLSSHTESFEDRYTPSPQRNVAKKSDGCGMNAGLLDKFEEVVEIAEDPESAIAPGNLHDENLPVNQFSSTAVAYFGDVSLHVGKKDRRKAHARLRNMKLSFHDDDISEECIAGPFSLLECELICRDEQTITIRLSEKEACRNLMFTAENDVETWTLLLGECWLSEYDLLRSSVQEATAFGTFWLRQGATGEWMYTAAALSGRAMFYVLLDSPDYVYEMDVRKVILLRERVDKVDWCPKCKKKDQKGPFLISLEGCALYVECCDDLSTRRWYSAIKNALSVPSTILEDCRLTADNIPILVDKCLRFVAVYGIHSEGIYRRNGKMSEASDIFNHLIENPVGTHIAPTTEETVYAVADVLRQFFRRLKSPLFPPVIHKDIFELVRARSSTENIIRYQGYRRILQQMPLVHYHTLRKLIAHLSEIVKYRDINKASTENLAKVFGPSLFNTTNDENACFEDTPEQIGAIIDLIEGYDIIFEITSREEICRAMVEQAQMTKAINPNATRADGLLVPIHVWQRENGPFNVKIDLAAEEVCRKAVARRGFDAPLDGNYAIYEVILDGALSRRLLPFEKLSQTVIDHWLTWKCTDGYFLFDHDQWPYDDSELDCFSGKLKIAEPGSKTFHSYEMKVENGVKLAAYKHDKLWKEWDVAEYMFYSGCSTNRKAPYPHNVTVFDKHSVCITDKFVGYCISFRLLPERIRFLNMIQFIETGGQPPPLLHL